mmetsp:Transcript_31514/g.53928  ORF Transcript_31514/g.53928 Transcript_31514/m.53928 type:complete len:200 (-) Transcript_31514:296-895(-)
MPRRMTKQRSLPARDGRSAVSRRQPGSPRSSSPRRSCWPRAVTSRRRSHNAAPTASASWAESALLQSAGTRRGPAPPQALPSPPAPRPLPPPPRPHSPTTASSATTGAPTSQVAATTRACLACARRSAAPGCGRGSMRRRCEETSTRGWWRGSRGRAASSASSRATTYARRGARARPVTTTTASSSLTTRAGARGWRAW